MRVRRHNDNWLVLDFEFNQQVIDVVKAIPGRVWNKEMKKWFFAADGMLAEHLKRLKSIGFDVSEVEEAFLKRSNEILLRSNLPLYQFQRDTAQFMLNAGSCLVCSFCGSGKTITTIAAIAAQGLPHNLIVCPKSVLWNWKKEIEQWIPGTKVWVMSGDKNARLKELWSARVSSQGGFVICTYDSMRIHKDELMADKWSSIVFDEVHYLVNTDSLRSKVARSLKADHKYGLTATPIMNSATDMYGCISAIKGPILGTYSAFVERYCYKDAQWNAIVGYQNLDELNMRIRPFLIRKTLQDAEFQLPEKVETDLIVELGEKEIALYTKIKQELLLELEEAEVSKVSAPVMLQMTLVKLGKLQELSDSMELLGDHKISSKLEALKEHLASIDGQAVIFTRFERMAQILNRELAEYGPCLLTGALDDIDRQQLMNEFATDRKRRVFISTEAGGAGINLQTANYLYNFDLPFSLGKLEQRIGRIYRHGQKKPVFIYNLMAKPGGRKGIDDWVKTKLLHKQELSDQLLIQQIKQELLYA